MSDTTGRNDGEAGVPEDGAFDGDATTGGFPIEVMVTARRSLSSFSLESLPDDPGDSISSVRITVHYPEFSRSLPLADSEWASRESETADLIACLRRDLVA